MLNIVFISIDILLKGASGYLENLGFRDSIF